ncbi:hypothetical protein PENTCL1PPCAC_12499, partial [Pristionchus entomophagus]
CSICGEKFYWNAELIRHNKEHFKMENRCESSLLEPREVPIGDFQLYPVEEEESTDTVNVMENGRPSRNAPRPLRYTDVQVNSDRNFKSSKDAPSEEYRCEICSRVFQTKTSLIGHTNAAH